jgi:hypothetical protein
MSDNFNQNAINQQNIRLNSNGANNNNVMLAKNVNTNLPLSSNRIELVNSNQVEPLVQVNSNVAKPIVRFSENLITNGNFETMPVSVDFYEPNDFNAVSNIQKFDNLNLSNGNNLEEIKKRNRRSLIEPLQRPPPPQVAITQAPSPYQQQQPVQQQNTAVITPLILQPNKRNEQALYRDLADLNIKKEKIDKVLAAIPFQNSVEAVNWLMRHSKDPMLNNDSVTSSREYILVMCPVGRLANQIGTFFQQSKMKHGPNEAHFNNLLPFIKLSPFFKLPDSQLINLHKAFDMFFNEPRRNLLRLNEINLDLHVTPQMILLYPDIDSENLIKEILATFYKTAFKFIEHEILPYSKQLHLVLGYNFDTEMKRSLEELAIQHINYRVPSEWELRLYSRDYRADGKTVSKTICML